MEKFYSKKTLSWSFVISVLINALIFFFCIKLLNVVYSIKKPLEVVLLVNNSIEKSYTDLSHPEKKAQVKINQKVLPNIARNKPVVKVNQKSAKEQLQTQKMSTSEAKTQDSNQLDISKNTINQISVANQASPKQNLSAENKSENIIQTQNATQSISKEDYTFLRKLIEKHLRYPYLARRNGYEGTVVVSFIILQDSSFKDINIVKSSGYSILDKSAIDAIKKIEPLVNIHKEVKIVVPIDFRLSNS
ncbi:MAG TPA: energy transducer TonB [Desulfurella acetivorans]|uniref:Energy transducer TonB n=1 Tax=Desulfurella acetivorans TaxID=33002 RepID=A0A7C6E8M8_DESAE|nr:energy transducer TonB [Desulfurella acetivorans]